MKKIHLEEGALIRQIPVTIRVNGDLRYRRHVRPATCLAKIFTEFWIEPEEMDIVLVNGMSRKKMGDLFRPISDFLSSDKDRLVVNILQKIENC